MPGDQVLSREGSVRDSADHITPTKDNKVHIQVRNAEACWVIEDLGFPEAEGGGVWQRWQLCFHG